ncbi:hypothetical protein Namu_0833 [Nakamurella multipartita DSM 44233]|jgi:hypothetical protein|uniref:NTP pyrophosphohydrolase n=2 Tax=Nakamurella TaxID=53460 RepID=C8X9H6_NAKMY|nr:hypothetical protein Namu_0833 [Nakamurella multipartita DSM 44233]
MEAVLLVDVANVMGSRPDGWWRDRRSAATRLLTALDPLIGIDVVDPDGQRRRIARVVAVVEGAARGAAPAGSHSVEVIAAPRDGDSTIATQAAQLIGSVAVAAVLVVTADRGLRARLPDAVTIAGPQWLNRLIGR